MEQYLNLGGNSNVKAYSIGLDYIEVVFGRGALYRYSYRSAGKDKVEQMKILARVIKPDIATGEYLETGNIMMINNFAKDEGSEFNV